MLTEKIQLREISMKIKTICKKLIITFGILITGFSFAAETENILTMSAGELRLSIDDKGRISALTDIKNGHNYISERGASYLLRIQNWNGKLNPKSEPVINPQSAAVVKKTGQAAVIELKYKNGEKLLIGIAHKKQYFKMKLLKAEPLDNITKVEWGPYFLAMREPRGSYIGIARSPDFSIGLLTLEINTDGEGWDHNQVATYDLGGTRLVQMSYDRSKPRALRRGCPEIISTPEKGLTVLGSAVALFGIKRGYDNELNLIEKIELAENLPHPMFKGKWAKRSRQVQKPCLWMTVNENDIDKCIELAEDFGAGDLCQFHGFFRNWGHFDLDQKAYPNGIDGVRSVSAKCKAAGICNTTYTLASFVKPHPEIEPFVAPVPDNRLAYLTLDSKLSLAESISTNSASIKLKLSAGLTPALEMALKKYRKVIRIDNEMIEFKSWKKLNENIIECSEITRSGWLTTAANHKAAASARFMYVSGYNNFYPGTPDMSQEVADNIGRVTVDGNLGVVILDGFESVLMAGQCAYGRNTYLKHIYDMTRANEVRFSASNTGNYAWHIMSYQSWGEYDLDKGFRGTMLELRLKYQVLLDGSLTPKKLGQYYPNKDTSVEDIEWLCNQIAGWNSGVDLSIGYDNIHQNPNYKKLASTFRLWEEARIKQVFSEKEKLNLRQTTSVYSLNKSDNGKFKLNFVRHWIDGRAEMLPASSFAITPVSGGADSLQKCGIDWKWTHNPAIYSRAALSDGLVYSTADKQTEWKLTPPAPPDERRAKDIGMRCVIRLAPDSACGVSNINLVCNDQLLDIRHAVINPGEYLAVPHNNCYAYIYDAKTHFVKRAIYIYQDNPYWFLPTMHKGAENKITLKCDPLKADSSAKIIVNIQCYDKYIKD
jgi:hypothetical protein